MTLHFYCGFFFFFLNKIQKWAAEVPLRGIDVQTATQYNSYISHIAQRCIVASQPDDHRAKQDMGLDQRLQNKW